MIGGPGPCLFSDFSFGSELLGHLHAHVDRTCSTTMQSSHLAHMHTKPASSLVWTVHGAFYVRALTAHNPAHGHEPLRHCHANRYPDCFPPTEVTQRPLLSSHYTHINRTLTSSCVFRGGLEARRYNQKNDRALIYSKAIDDSPDLAGDPARSKP